MDIDERIERQPGSHLVRVPRKQIAALKRERDKAIAERDAYMLKAAAMRTFPMWELSADGTIREVRRKSNDHLTLSAAHRLIQSLAGQTQSRAELDECRDVMAALARMVDDA